MVPIRSIIYASHDEYPRGFTGEQPPVAAAGSYSMVALSLFGSSKMRKNGCFHSANGFVSGINDAGNVFQTSFHKTHAFGRLIAEYCDSTCKRSASTATIAWVLLAAPHRVDRSQVD